MRREREENMKTAVVHADITDKIGDMSIKTKEKISQSGLLIYFIIKNPNPPKRSEIM